MQLRRSPRLAHLPALLAGIMVGCGGSTGTAAPPLAVLTTVAVSLSPASIAVGQTTTATASGTDQRGQTYSVASFTWISSDPGIASVSASGVVTGVTPGQATVTATALGIQGQQVVAVTAPPTGSLTVSIAGLPAGAGVPKISVTGPGGYSNTLTTVRTLTGLAVGQYTLTAQTLFDSATGLAYSAAPQTISVVANATATPTIAYTNTTGALTLTIAGIPQSGRVTITFVAPDGTTSTLTTNGTIVISSVVEGTYVLSTPAVTISGTTYTPTPSSQSVVIRAGTNTHVTFAFAAG